MRSACIFLLVLSGLLHGCAAAVGAGAAGSAAVLYDRRTTGTFVDDGIIELKAYDVLRTDKNLWKQSHINVTSFNNIVLLTGETPSETMRKRVADRVEGVRKVRRVHNEITVAAPSAGLSRSSDTWITGKVKTKLLASKEAEAARIKVVTESGTVYLMGLVTRAEADVATDLSRRVSGVQRVVKLFEYLD